MIDEVLIIRQIVFRKSFKNKVDFFLVKVVFFLVASELEHKVAHLSNKLHHVQTSVPSMRSSNGFEN